MLCRDRVFYDLLNRPFLEEWRKFIKDPLKNPPIQNIGNSILVCEHGGYLYPHNEGQLELFKIWWLHHNQILHFPPD
jgi:hypothetical protein